MRTVKTPLGTFNTITDAAKAHKISHGLMRAKISSPNHVDYIAISFSSDPFEKNVRRKRKWIFT